MLAWAPGAPHALRVEVQRFTGAHPAARLGMHGHEFYELLYVERGAGTHRVGAVDVPAEPGDLFVLAPGETHSAADLAGVEGTLVLFCADALDPALSDVARGDAAAGSQAGAAADDDELFALPGDLIVLSFLRLNRGRVTHLRVPEAERAEWERGLTGLGRELRERRFGYVDAARALLQLLLVQCARLAQVALSPEGSRAARAEGAARHRPLLTAVFRLIAARFREPLTLADVARAVHLSPAYLTDVVRRETGRPVLAWVAEWRMAEARRLLLETDRDMAGVGRLVGYGDPGYFVRRYRRMHGLTPRAWRNAHRAPPARVRADPGERGEAAAGAPGGSEGAAVRVAQ